MAKDNGVNINGLDGGLGRSSDNLDGVSMLVASFPIELPSTVQAKKTYTLNEPADLNTLGLTESYDANNLCMVRHHVEEYFRQNPEGVLVLLPLGEEKEIVASIPDILPAVRANKDVKGLGFVGFTNTLATISANVASVQANLVDVLRSENRFIDHVLIEGKGAAALEIDELPNLRELTAKNVSVIIAQDLDVAALDAAYKYYASVGTALGGVAIRKVNENLGSVNIENKPREKRGTENYTLTDEANGIFVKSGISLGIDIETVSGPDFTSLKNKGYIMVAGFEGYGGYYFTNSSTCISKSSDYANIENNRVFNKAARGIRAKLIPLVRGRVKKDPTTGFIKSTTISYWQNQGRKPLEQMEKDDEISGFDFFIDRKQIVVDETPVKGKVKIVIDGIVHEFDIDLGLTKSLV